MLTVERLYNDHLGYRRKVVIVKMRPFVERVSTRVNVWIFCPPGRRKVAFVSNRGSSLIVREVAVSRGSTAFYLSARVRALPILTLLIFEVGS